MSVIEYVPGAAGSIPDPEAGRLSPILAALAVGTASLLSWGLFLSIGIALRSIL